jgi:molybdenum ABC transporter molybdate-binding protein
MRRRRGRPGFLSNAWLVSGTSLLAVLVLSLLLWSPWDRPGIRSGRSLRLYCAAGLQKPVAEIIKKYAQEYGVTVEPTYGGSGELLSMIRAASDAGDLFLSADTLTMDEALKSGDVAETMPVVVMRPVLVVNTKTQKKLRAAGKPVTSAFDLLRKDLKVYLAAESASIGKIGRLKLESLGIWAKLEERRRAGVELVSTAGTVNKVAETVALAEGYVGIVWDAVAWQFPNLVDVQAPEFKGVQENVIVGVVKRSRQPTAALQFARYLTARDRGEEVFGRHKYTTIPDADDWAERPEIRLSAGAMLRPAVEDALKAFAQREGVTILPIYLGCGTLVAQMDAIKHGREKSKQFPDAYFACDTTFLDSVQQWFQPGETVSQNYIVLIVRKGNPKNVHSLEDLARPDLRVGLPHPEKSAIGKLTDDLLERVGVHEKVYAPGWEKHIVYTSEAHDLVNKLVARALDVAVVYRSNALATPENEREHLDVIPLDLPGAKARQPFAIAADTRHPYLLRRLRAALVAEQSAGRFRQLGFDWVYSPK